MKLPKNYWSVSIAACLCAAAAHAQQDETNRITMSARFGFNISARFKGFSTLPSPPSSNRKTPSGDSYNYDNGYVLTDQSGNFGGQTWYWGYDNSAQQISGNNIVLSRSTLESGAGSATAKDNPDYGGELVYYRLLDTKGKLRLGFELAANFLNLSMNDSRTLSAGVSRTSYPFPFAPGTTPPSATPGAPYQGSFEGPGFVIGDTPGEPTTAIVPGGATIEGHRKFDANLWGFRMGPSLEYPVNQYLKFGLSGGFAGALVDAEASWSETITIEGTSSAPLTGSDDTLKTKLGWYVGATASWQFAERWSVLAGVQYQGLGTFRHSFGGRQVELDLTKSLFATIGVGFSF